MTQDKDAVKDIQNKLTAHGYSVGEIDGLWGKNSQAALDKFQREKKLPLTKMVDDATMAALNAPLPIVEDAPKRVQEPSKITSVAAKDVIRVNIWPTQANVPKFFGEVGKNQVSVKLPYTMYLAWDKRRSVNAITLHAKVADSASEVFKRIANTYDEKARTEIGIHLFGGSLNVRKMRGGSAYSMHSWGIAIDFDPERNQLKWGRDKARLAKDDAKDFFQIWEEAGWVSLGRTRNYDWMHLQAAR